MANGIIPVAPSDVSNIPPLALGIPDFEGQAILRIFANSTESEIACYSALVTNGNTFAHPAAVGSVLGIFTVVALLSSFATAIYGNHVPSTRIHYAHSISVFVVFSVFQHIFFTGALSMNWPSVLAAFWSNFAWSGGMIYSEFMQNSINQLIGNNKGNTSIVGAAGSGTATNNLGGGYSISQIYKRSILTLFRRVNGPSDLVQMLRTRELEKSLAKRDLVNATDGYTWYGYPVKPGLPLPGNFSGFAGTLSAENIPASNAFMTGFLWFLILVAIVAGSVVGLKWALEGLSKAKLVKQDRLSYFRTHWLGFAALAALRTTFIAFFMIMFLTLFQFTYKESAGVTIIAAIVFVIFFVGFVVVAGYACFYRLRFGRYETVPDRMHFEKTKSLDFLPWYGVNLESKRSEEENPKVSAGSLPWWRLHYRDNDVQRVQVHDDEDYIQKFGWLSSRFRRTRWWFFTAWLLYEFIRACFYGGAAGHPLTQVFGLLVVEFIALVFIITMKPFEATRLNALMVYLLGFSKVATVALSAAFDERFDLARITTAAIGIVIIVIQGILTIVLLIAIVVGAISSYMSITRNREEFKPKSWTKLRQKYFAHIEQVATDLPPPPPPIPEEPKEPYFSVKSVQRCPKIEDEDAEFDNDLYDPTISHTSLPGPVGRSSRPGSLRSQHSHGNVPFGARVHRVSWSNRDFTNWQEASNRNSELMGRSGMHSMKSDASLRDSIAQRSRPPSRSVSSPLEGRKSRAGKEKAPALDEEKE
ncbi:hypothetical protein MMC12_007695 [Toensbergia leucococca]|nr:hypothetical protein [Toensbergia leucococca]